MVVERPPVKSTKLEPRPVASRADHLAEYAELAASIGVTPPEIGIESFKDFLSQNDIPIFSLTEVIAYMDDKAAKESKEKCGWEWHPLRVADHIRDSRFGTEAKRTYEGRADRQVYTQPASDFYLGPHQAHHMGMGGQTMAWEHSGSRVYDKTVPLHALRKVSLIGKHFKDSVKFFVCDYALAPAIQYPDPFLMAVVPNAALDKGVGRFIVDFWDEPGFGLEQQLKK